MKIAVVGAGWFGAHIAATLQSRGIEYELFEKADRLFAGASGHNQNRLHLGFHYPRSAVTRRQSFEFAETFQHVYPSLSAPVAENIYAVVGGESLIDWETYRAIYGNGPWWSEESPADYGLKNVAGCLSCQERVILTNKAREYFTDKLGAHVRLNAAFNPKDCELFDHTINCTYQTWLPHRASNLVYEPCVTLIYEAATEVRSRAVTLMDGNFYSIYPYDEGRVTLYGVRESRLNRQREPWVAQQWLRSTGEVEISSLRQRMENGVSCWLPSFRETYKYSGWHGAVRAISQDASDARVCKVVQEGKMVHVLSGKIDSIFHAEREVLKCLGC